MLHMKQLNSKKTRFPRFDKILVIQPIAEVYGVGNESQLYQKIAKISYGHVTKIPCDDGLLSEPTTEVNGIDP